VELTADLMTRDPLAVTSSTPLAKCARIMSRHHIRHLPVISDDRHVLGMLTDVACFRRGSLIGLGDEMWIPFNPGDFGMIAAEAITPVSVVAREHDDASRTLRRLAESKQDFAVVVDAEEQLVGILTEHDAVRVAAALLLGDATVGAESSTPVHVTSGSSSALDAMNRMDSLRIRHLAVLDDHHLIGVISRGDLVADNAAGKPELRVEDVMRERTLYTVGPTDTLLAAAGIMTIQRVGCLPVVNSEGDLLRIITRTDLIKAAGLKLNRPAVSQRAPSDPQARRASAPPRNPVR